MRSITIELPHLPPGELTANNRRREHWSVQHQATQDAKQECGWLAKIQWHDQKPMVKARISYEFHYKDHRVHDLDGWLAACKPYPDALIEVNVIAYDDSKHLEYGSISAVTDIEDKTVIKVEEV